MVAVADSQNFSLIQRKVKAFRGVLSTRNIDALQYFFLLSAWSVRRFSWVFIKSPSAITGVIAVNLESCGDDAVL